MNLDPKTRIEPYQYIGTWTLIGVLQFRDAARVALSLESKLQISGWEEPGGRNRNLHFAGSCSGPQYGITGTLQRSRFW